MNNLFKNLLINDIRNRYSGSLLGLMWTIINPLASFFVYYFVFSEILKVKLGFEYSEVNFSVWLIAGLLPWLFFSETLIRSTSTIIENSNLVTKTLFPSQIMPIVICLSSFINHLIALVILLISLFLLGYHFSFDYFLLLIYFIPLFLYSIGLSWILASLNVFLRDIGQFIGILINIWFYMTPIIYPLNSIPQYLMGFLGWNPISPIVDGYRQLFFKGKFIDIGTFAIITFFGIVVFALGYLIFIKLKKSFGDVL